MKITDILTPAHTRCGVHAKSKKRALQTISKLATQDLADIDTKAIMDSLIAREKLGTTAIGHGIALPHTRIKGIDKPIGVFIRLDEPLDFDAVDDQPVDLLFSLLAPENAPEAHLEALSKLAQVFSNKAFRERCHHANSSDELYQLAISMDGYPS